MKKKYYFFAIYILFVLFPIFKFSHQIVKAERPVPNSLYPVQPIPFLINQSLTADLGKSLFNFRSDLSRSGSSNEITYSDYISITLVPDLNIGIHSASKSSPAVDESGIYVGSDTGHFYALDRYGQIKWTYIASDANRGIHSTAALDQHNVYFGTYAGDLIALDKTTGEVQWIIKLGGVIGSSPVILQDAIYITVETTNIYDGYVVKVDRKNGKIIWRSQYLGNQSHSSPTVDLKNNLILIGANSNKIFAFDLSTGLTKWEALVDDQIKSTGLSYQGFFYITSWDSYLYKIDNSDGKIIWKKNLEGRSQSSPALSEQLGSIVVSSESGYLFAIDLNTGKEKWKLKVGGASMRYPSPIISDVKTDQTKIWIACFENYICSVNTANGKLLQKYDVQGVISGEISIYHGVLYGTLREGGLVTLFSKSDLISTLNRAVNKASESRIARNNENGSFVYEFSTSKAHQSPEQYYSLTRHGGVIYSLNQYEQKYKNKIALKTIQNGNRYLSNLLKPVTATSSAFFDSREYITLGSTSLGLVSLIASQKSGLSSNIKNQIPRIANHILKMQKNDGSFYSTYSLSKGANDENYSPFFPGEAILALLYSADFLDNPVYFKAALNGLEYLAKTKVEKKSWPLDHWALIATEKLAQLIKKQRSPISKNKIPESILLHTRETTISTINYFENLNSSYELIKSTSDLATVAEGLISACKILCENDNLLKQKVRSTVLRIMLYLLSTQSKTSPYPGSFANQVHEESNTAYLDYRIDVTQHSLSALISTLEML